MPLALAIATTVAVRAIAGAPQDQLQFRAGTDVVAVDFYAVDKDGNPVLGLKPEELALRVGKESRPIRSLEFILASRRARTWTRRSRRPSARRLRTDRICRRTRGAWCFCFSTTRACRRATSRRRRRRFRRSSISSRRAIAWGS